MTEEAATQEGVEDTDQEAVSKVADVRQDAIEAIAEQREEEIQAEIDELNPPGEEGETTEEESISEPEPEEEAEQLVRVKVDGEEVEMPLSEVLKGYQKDATASKRLDQVASERQELDRQQEEFEIKKAQGAEQQANVETTQPEQQDNQPSNDVDTHAVKLRLANAYDDLSVAVEDDDRIKAVDEIREIEELLSGRGGDNPAINADEIAQQAAQQATKEVQIQMQHQNARTRFIDDYQDVVESTANDQLRTNAFNSLYSDALKTSKSYDEAFKKAGDDYREWNGVAASNGRQDKIALKEKLETEPVKVGSRANPAPAKPAETQSDIIAGMRSGRGQPV